MSQSVTANRAESSAVDARNAHAQDLKKKAGRFRILVIGRANAGKTTILQKVCNTTEEPEIYDAKGEKVRKL
jgi:septin family protein